MAQEYRNKIDKKNNTTKPSIFSDENPVIGTIIENGKISEFKIPLQYFKKNLLICGDSCTGKSSVIKRILLQIIEETNLNPIIFDDNSEYNKLVNSGWLNRETLVIHFGRDNFTINPLEFLKRDDERYLDILIDIFRISFNLNIAELFILREIILILKEDVEKPTLADLKLYLECAPDGIKIFSEDIIKNAMAHLKTILTALTKGPNREIFECESGNINIGKLQDFPMIIKFSSINQSAKKFIKNLIFLNQLHFKKTKSSNRPHLMVCDPIIDISETLLDFNETENLNEAIIGSLKTPFKKQKRYIKRFRNHILLHISSEEDIKFLKKNIEEIKPNQLNRLEMGSSIIKLCDNRIRLVQIDDFYF
ncbi:MAG: DUF87 domain-containing protein [Promethearchaeota archaeon]|nr:MAG: DUF87 domain-containing protein [Candidatus Lokiarchaeota archaeon]